jgi:hypothetical protein
VQVSHKTAASWLEVLERLYAVCRLPPFGALRVRAVNKERKHYHPLATSLAPAAEAEAHLEVFAKRRAQRAAPGVAQKVGSMQGATADLATRLSCIRREIAVDLKEQPEEAGVGQQFLIHEESLPVLRQTRR